MTQLIVFVSNSGKIRPLPEGGGFLRFEHVSWSCSCCSCSEIQHLIGTFIDLGSGDLLAAWEGPIELMLSKVKNASGRVGVFIFSFCVQTRLIYIGSRIILGSL